MKNAVQEPKGVVAQLPQSLGVAEGGRAKPPQRVFIPLEKLKPNPDQARRMWDTSKDEQGQSSLDRLAESIRQNGLLSDLTVTPQDGHYLIVCGERRFRAIKDNRLMAEVPCLVREGLSPAQLLELNIIENLQREDLTPIDEANAYKALMEKCGYTQAALAKRLVIEVDLAAKGQPSRTGKSILIASTRGNEAIPDTGAVLGLNVYRTA